MRRRFPLLLSLVAFLGVLWTVPAWWCGRGAGRWFQGDPVVQDALADTVADQTGRGLSLDDFHTPSVVFDGEWLFGTHLMAGIGWCQIVRQRPEELSVRRGAIESSIRRLLDPEVRAFDRHAWGRDALEALDADTGHAAYLGYLNFLLALYRDIDPNNPFGDLNDRVTETLIRRAGRSPNGLIETYPGEWYPVDNAPALASIALTAQATGREAPAFVRAQERVFRERFVDPVTGLLAQSVDERGVTRQNYRGSGTTLAAFFLSRGCPELGRELFGAVQKQLVSGVFRFGAIREYPRGTSGRADIDSGPVIFGFGFSATGFALGGARAYGDRDLFTRLSASAVLAGAPVHSGTRMDFLTAGPLGNAILLAMLTTPPAGQP